MSGVPWKGGSEMPKTSNMNKMKMPPRQYNALMNALKYAADEFEADLSEAQRGRDGTFTRGHEKIGQYSYVSSGEFDFETREIKYVRFVCTDREKMLIGELRGDSMGGFSLPGYDRDYADGLIDSYAAWLERKREKASAEVAKEEAAARHAASDSEREQELCAELRAILDKMSAFARSKREDLHVYRGEPLGLSMCRADSMTEAPPVAITGSCKSDSHTPPVFA